MYANAISSSAGARQFHAPGFWPKHGHKAPTPEPIEEPLPGEHPVPQEDPLPSPNPEIDDPKPVTR